MLILLGNVSTAADNAVKRPNILWITVEDISPFVGAYGDKLATTPNIDQLAREGTRYTRAYTVAGVCSPSRASLITGMYPTAIGAQHMRTGGSEFGRAPSADGADKNDAGMPVYSAVLPPEVRPFPELLRKAGYYTTNNHKTDYQFETPVTVWDENSPAASYRNAPAGQPFFSVFNFAITHESMIGFRKKDPLLTEPDAVTVPPLYPDTPTVRRDIARLYTNIQIMDRQVGELIQQLKDDGVYENTIIFFFSDNGGNLPWMKREITERGTHIPLIVRLPGQRNRGNANHEMISGVDFAPTVLSLAGIELPAYLNGQAFLGTQKANTPRRYVFAARDRMDEQYDHVRMVRDNKFRYLYNFEPEKPYYQDIKYRINVIPMMKEILALRDSGELPAVTATWFKAKPVEELYDVDRDPWELTNLAYDPRYREKLMELRAAFRQWEMDYPDLGGVPESEMVRRMWNGTEAQPVTAKTEIVQAENGLKLKCATAGAVIGYWVERNEAEKPVFHTTQSWDFAVYFGGKNGAPIKVPPSWRIYDGESITLQAGDILHTNAQRIGYKASEFTYRRENIPTP